MLVSAWALIFFTLSYPILITIFENLASTELKLFFNNFSSDRYAIHLSFIELWRDNIFGVGYHMSQNHYFEYKLIGSEIAEKKLVRNNFASIGPHSTFIRVLVELGIQGYFLFSLFVLKLTHFAQSISSVSALLGASIFFSFLWLDGLNEFIFYFFIASLFHKRPDINANRL